MADQTKQEVTLIIPISQNMEFTAAKTASILAKLMDFEDQPIEEIQLAIIEACINAFEHSHSEDGQVFIDFIMGEDELELRVTDHGIGFQSDQVDESRRQRPENKGELQKRGWGLEIIRHMMDKVELESTENGTTVTMVKKKQPSN